MALPELCAMNVHHRFFSLESFLTSAEAAGFTAVELWTGPMHVLCDRAGHADPAPIRETLARHGLACRAVCPEQTNPKPANMAAPGQAGERARAVFANAVRLAASLGAPVVTVTPGWAYLDENPAEAWGRAVAALRALAAQAEDAGVTLAMEALQSDESVLCPTSERLAALIAEVGRPALRACLDTGAMEAAGETIEQAWNALDGSVANVHLADVAEKDGSLETHVAWGTGHRSMADDLATLASLGYAGSCSAEVCDPTCFTDPAAVDARTYQLYVSARKELS